MNIGFSAIIRVYNRDVRAVLETPPDATPEVSPMCAKDTPSFPLFTFKSRPPIDIQGDVAFIPLLHKDEVVSISVIDAIDVPLVQPYRWLFRKRQGGDNYYAHTNAKKDGQDVWIMLHRLLLSPPDGMVIDHINGDGLDNRRCNMRITTVTQNNRNRGKGRNNSSGFKGVYWSSVENKWRVQIRNGKGKVWIGKFNDLTEAARAYDKAARELHGEFAVLNFPEEVGDAD